MALSVVNHLQAFLTAQATSITSGSLNITAGNLIVVATLNANDNDAATNPLIDSVGNTYTNLGKGGPVLGFYVQYWYAKNVIGGSAVTWTYTTSATNGFPAIFVAQVAGADTTSPSEATPVWATSGTGGPLTTPAYTTTDANVILFGVELDTGNVAITFSDGGAATGGWTKIEQNNSNNGMEGAFAYAIVSSTSSNWKVTATGSTGGNVIVGLTGFKAGASNALSSVAPASGTVVVAGGSAQRINFTGTGTTWTTTAPTITAGAGTLGAITVDTATTAHATYTPPASAQTVTFTDSTDGNTTATLTVSAASTTYTFTGPSSGLPSVASSNFTVALPASTAVNASVTVTPSDGGAGGTFTPSTVTLVANTPAASATFTYTPTATTGARTLSVTNSGGLTDPASRTYTVTNANPGYPGDLNMVASSNIWKITANTSMESVLMGSTIKLAVVVPSSPTTDQQSLAVEVDVTTPGAYTAGWPVIEWSIDSGDTTFGGNGSAALQSTVGTLVSGNVRRITMSTTLAAGTHVVYVNCTAGSGTDSEDTWTNSVFKVIRFCTVAGSQITSAAWPYPRSKRLLAYGDSEMGRFGWAFFLAEALDAEFDCIAKTGIGLTNNANCTAGWPAVTNGVYHVGAVSTTISWDKYYAGNGRLVSGQFAQQPDYIVVSLGSNDGGATSFQADLTAFLGALRTAAPGAWIFVVPSLNRTTPYSISDFYPKVSPAVTAAADAKTKLIDLSTVHNGEMLLGMSSGSPSAPHASRRASDGEHPYFLGSTPTTGAIDTTAEMGVHSFKLINALLNPGGGFRRTTFLGGISG